VLLLLLLLLLLPLLLSVAFGGDTGDHLQA